LIEILSLLFYLKDHNTYAIKAIFFVIVIFVIAFAVACAV